MITRRSKDERLAVYLLRSADGYTWIVQAYTDSVDKIQS